MDQRRPEEAPYRFAATDLQLRTRQPWCRITLADLAPFHVATQPVYEIVDEALDTARGVGLLGFGHDVGVVLVYRAGVATFAAIAEQESTTVG